MKVFKWLMAGVLIIALLVGVVVFVGLKNLDALVEAAVEQAGTQVTGSAVELDAATIQLAEGRAELKGFSIANPRGFSEAQLLDIDNIAVDIDPKSVTGDVLVIDEIAVSGMAILAEQKRVNQNQYSGVAR